MARAGSGSTASPASRARSVDERRSARNVERHEPHRSQSGSGAVPCRSTSLDRGGCVGPDGPDDGTVVVDGHRSLPVATLLAACGPGRRAVGCDVGRAGPSGAIGREPSGALGRTEQDGGRRRGCGCRVGGASCRAMNIRGAATPDGLAAWVAGARPRTLPAAVVPVALGAAAAFAADPPMVWWRVLPALIVSLALQVGVNYANDYSDGIRGTADIRVGPLRLVASGTSRRVPSSERRSHASASPGSPGWHWRRHQLVAAGRRGRRGRAAATPAVRSPMAISASVSCSCSPSSGSSPLPGPRTSPSSGSPGSAWRCSGSRIAARALLAVNNLRDIPTDANVGKQTLAVRLGDRRAPALCRVDGRDVRVRCPRGGGSSARSPACSPCRSPLGRCGGCWRCRRACADPGARCHRNDPTGVRHHDRPRNLAHRPSVICGLRSASAHRAAEADLSPPRVAANHSQQTDERRRLFEVDDVAGVGNDRQGCAEAW